MNQKKSRTETVYETGILLVSMLLCLCAVIVFARFFAADTAPIAYPLQNGVNNYDPYVQQFDALQKGQTNIDYPADPRLAELDNVYDYTERTASRIYYLWDRAYYDGKYYCYFGIAPVLTVYYPYYLLNGSLPGTGTVMIVFAIMAAIFLPLFFCLWRMLFAPRIPAVLSLAAAPALFWGSLILLIARGRTPFYYVACAAAIGFLSLFAFLMLAAYSSAGQIVRCVLYALAGIAFGLLFQSRTVTAVAAALLVLPSLWFLIIGRSRKKKGKEKLGQILAELCALGVPVAAFFAGSMIFNAMRFSGPLDFGNNYNLTVADVGSYRLRLSDLPFALFHYLFDMPAKADVYPYISFSYVKFTDYGHYLYRDAGLGMFAVPAAACMLLSPAVIFSGRYPASRRVFTACGLFAVITVPWLDFCLGGVIYRYLSDFSLIAVFFGITSLLSLCETAAETGKNHKRLRSALVYTGAALVLLLSVWVSLRLCLINGNGNVMSYPGELAASVEKIIRFLPPKGVS